MSLTEEDARAYVRNNINHLNRLRKTITTLATAQDILRYMSRLHEACERARISYEAETLMDIDAFTTAIVMSYGRLFNESKGAPVFKKKLIPTHLLMVHEEIISLRNERYAHHGDHKTLAAELKLFIKEDRVDVKIIWRASVKKEISPDWQELFEWTHSYIKNSFHKQIDYLDRTSGKKWKNFDPQLNLEGVTKETE